MKMFDLKKGDRFKLNDEKFTVIGWIKRFMPTLGRVYNLKTITDDGKVSLFITNFEITKL